MVLRQLVLGIVLPSAISTSSITARKLTKKYIMMFWYYIFLRGRKEYGIFEILITELHLDIFQSKEMQAFMNYTNVRIWLEPLHSIRLKLGSYWASKQYNNLKLIKIHNNPIMKLWAEHNSILKSHFIESKYSIYLFHFFLHTK